MLKLSENWQLSAGGATALKMLEQLPDETRKVQFSRTFIHASLDLAVATFFGRKRPGVMVTELPSGIWSIRGLRYLFLPTVDDDSFAACQEAFPDPHGAFVIAPTNHEVVLRKALQCDMNGAAPNVMSFDGFINWRETFAGADASWSRERALRYLFARYNTHAKAAKLPRSMMIRIPQEVTDNQNGDITD